MPDRIFVYFTLGYDLMLFRLTKTCKNTGVKQDIGKNLIMEGFRDFVCYKIVVIIFNFNNTILVICYSTSNFGKN